MQLLEDLAKQMAAVGMAQYTEGSSKFSGELKGGQLDVFYKDVTGVYASPTRTLKRACAGSTMINPLR